MFGSGKSKFSDENNKKTESKESSHWSGKGSPVVTSQMMGFVTELLRQCNSIEEKDSEVEALYLLVVSVFDDWQYELITEEAWSTLLPAARMHADYLNSGGDDDAQVIMAYGGLINASLLADENTKTDYMKLLWSVEHSLYSDTSAKLKSGNLRIKEFSYMSCKAFSLSYIFDRNTLEESIQRLCRISCLGNDEILSEATEAYLREMRQSKVLKELGLSVNDCAELLMESFVKIHEAGGMWERHNIEEAVYKFVQVNLGLVDYKPTVEEAERIIILLGGFTHKKNHLIVFYLKLLSEDKRSRCYGLIKSRAQHMPSS